MGTPRLRQQKNRRKESLWLVQELVCTWSVRKTLTLLTWRHEDIEESDAGGDGQRRGANKRRSNGIFQTIGLIRQSYASWGNSRSTFSRGNSVRIMGISTTGPAVQNHISSEMERELIAIYRTMYHLWFLVHQRVLSPTSPSSSLQDSVIDVNRHTSNPVPERCGSTSEELRGTPLHKPTENENKTKTKDAKTYKAIHCMTCRTCCRISERLWSMNVVLQSHGETLRPRIETLPVLLINYQWGREQKWNRVRVSTVSTRTFWRTQIAICAWRQK